MRGPIWPYVLLAGLCALLFFWRLGATPLMGLDEGLYAECSREMLATGDYVVPTCNGGPFFEKPPVAYWLQAASMRAFGINSFAARLPSAVEELLLVALTVFLGTRFFGRRAGLMAGFALATSIVTVGLARMAITDAAFALCITASLGAFLLAYAKLAPRWAYLVFWAAMGLSAMVKGPAGPALILATVLVFLLIRRDLRSIRTALPLAGLCLALAIALPWYILVEHRTGGAFLKEFIFHQNLDRALGADFQHNARLWFYPLVYLVGFFPWSIFLPAAFLESRKHESRCCPSTARPTVHPLAPSPGGEGWGEGASAPSPGGEGWGEGASAPSPGGEGWGEGASAPSPGGEGWGEGASAPPPGGEGWGEGASAPSPGGEGWGEGASAPSPGGEGWGEGASAPSPGGEGWGEGASAPSPGGEGWGEGASAPPPGGEGWGEGASAPSPGGEGWGEGASAPSPGGEGWGEGASAPSPGGEGWGEGASAPSPGGEGWGEGASAPSPGGEGWGEGAITLFLTVWIAVIFLTFSLLISKLPAYIFPIYPPSALLIGVLWSRACETGKLTSIRRSALAAAILACLIGAAMLIAPSRLHEPIPGLKAALIPMAVCLLCGCAACWLLLLVKRQTAAFVALCCGVGAVLLVAVELGLPIAARPNAQPAAEIARMISPRTEPAIAYRLSPPQPALGFYAGRAVKRIDTAKQLNDVLRARPDSLIVAQTDRRDGLPPQAEVLARVEPYIVMKLVHSSR